MISLLNYYTAVFKYLIITIPDPPLVLLEGRFPLEPPAPPPVFTCPAVAESELVAPLPPPPAPPSACGESDSYPPPPPPGNPFDRTTYLTKDNENKLMGFTEDKDGNKVYTNKTVQAFAEIASYALGQTTIFLLCSEF
jgi:hypothetical protein